MSDAKLAPQPTPCAFCGHPDSRHRLIDAIVSRFEAGEDVEALAEDYQLTVDFVCGVIDGWRRGFHANIESLDDWTEDDR